MFDFILFDFDGTISDSAEGITRCVQYALCDQGIEAELSELYCFCGPPLADMFQQKYGMSPELAARAVEKYRERYRETGVYESCLYPGVDTVLRTLHGAGRRLAVASSKPEVFVRLLLERFGVLGAFDVLVGAQLDGSFGRKAEVVREALRRLGVTPEQCGRAVLVGDRFYDVNGAHEAGIACIGASYGYAEPGELQRTGADFIADTPEDLLPLLL